MRQVMPNRSDIVSDPDDCKSLLHKKTGTYHSFGRTTDRPFQLAVGFATSKAACDSGLKTYADIAKFKDQLDGKLYGIEPGSGANGTISEMISDNTFGLSGFKLVESSEQAMLAETAHRIKEGKPVVFFGWQPHPMNVDLPMVYLQKGNDVFGPNDGGAAVVTLTRAGYAKECPNVERLLSNLTFDSANRLMSDILD
ncbi:MAG TPA: glycine betaine ABC transporter substrate-binding protein [Roseiarcus sp.]